jgi:hypothetical protein
MQVLISYRASLIPVKFDVRDTTRVAGLLPPGVDPYSFTSLLLVHDLTPERYRLGEVRIFDPVLLLLLKIPFNDQQKSRRKDLLDVQLLLRHGAPGDRPLTRVEVKPRLDALPITFFDEMETRVQRWTQPSRRGQPSKAEKMADFIVGKSRRSSAHPSAEHKAVRNGVINTWTACFIELRRLFAASSGVFPRDSFGPH